MSETNSTAPPRPDKSTKPSPEFPHFPIEAESGHDRRAPGPRGLQVLPTGPGSRGTGALH
jgi:hypothetical protein